jgi:hypothetical protein
VILVHGTQQQAEAERDTLAEALRERMGLTLSPDKSGSPIRPKASNSSGIA